MKKFIRRLGKKVQKLLDKIFGKKNKKPQEKVLTGDCWGFNNLGPGEIFIDGLSIGKTSGISIISEDQSDDNNIVSLFEDDKINSCTLNFSTSIENPKNFSNIPLTLLPKRYLVKTLLISIAANQENDYIAVDMSQYEDKGLAHYIRGRKANWEEILDEYVFTEKERNFFQEEIEMAKEYGVYSSILKDATLLHYENLGLWQIEE